MNLNRATLIGNLTRDPEGRTTPDGTQVCSFGLATNMIWKDKDGNRQERAEYHNIVAWRRLAEICTQYLKKGSKIYVEGRLQTKSWEDQSGVKRYRTEIVAENMIMLDRPGVPNNSVNETNPPYKTEEVPPHANTPEAASGQQSEEINVEEIPF